MYNIGIDIGGSKIAFGVVDENGNIVHRTQIYNNAKINSEEQIKNIGEELQKIIHDYEGINSIGIGFPGKVNMKGVILNAPNIYFSDIDLAKELYKYTEIPIYVDNDANCAAVAEYVHGSLKGTRNSVFITLGTGVGGGIIIGGELYKGINGGAGELGHQVIVMDGKQCGCGRRGCYEAYASTHAWEKRIIENLVQNKTSKIYELINGNPDELNAKVIFNAIDMGDDFAQKSFKEHLSYIAVGIINLFEILEPDVISIGGGITAVKEKLLNPLLEEIEFQMKKCIFPLGDTKIRIAELGNDAGIIGAAELYRFK
ncbi:MAG TPA: glucokinase [Clostridiales bacterium]|nr:MAG: hypothetical protein A2Y18_06455 [Clostridiales bacterium GWD2_32_19]HCC07950.1 glucokinase [Clostridiales bacterium]